MEAQLILTRPIKEYMTDHVITVLPDDTLYKVDEVFAQHNIHHVPVVDDQGVLQGIISKSDLLLIKDWGTNFHLSSSEKKNNFLLKSNLASDLMSSPVVFLYEDDLVEKCLDIFRENYFRAIPIVNEDKILRGIITPYDMLVSVFRPSFLIES